MQESRHFYKIKSPILRKTIVGDVLFCLEASVGRTVPDNRFACYPRLFLSRPIDIRLIDILSADKKIHIAPFRWQNGNPYLRENTINTAVRSLSRLQPIKTGACLTFCHFDKDYSIGTSIKSTVACFRTSMAMLSVSQKPAPSRLERTVSATSTSPSITNR